MTKYDEFLGDLKPEDWQDALRRSAEAYRRFTQAGMTGETAALLVVAAQIDWLSTTLVNNMSGEEG